MVRVALAFNPLASAVAPTSTILVVKVDRGEGGVGFQPFGQLRGANTETLLDGGGEGWCCEVSNP